MAKRRSVQSFIEEYRALAEKADVRGYERLLDKHRVPEEQKKVLMDRFKRVAEMVVRSSVRLPK